jgi:hypothetical protein
MLREILAIGAAGFEPAKTSRTQTERSTRLSYAPMWLPSLPPAGAILTYCHSERR